MSGWGLDISDVIDSNQKRTRLQDPKDPKVYTITNILIYSSFYYPNSKHFLLQVIAQLKNHTNTLEGAIHHLFKCIQREAITGPSSSFLPPSELPPLHHDDSQLKLDYHERKNRVNDIREGLLEMELLNLFEKDDLSQLEWYNCQLFLSQLRVQQHRDAFKLYQGELELDGESWMQTAPFSSIYCTLYFVLEAVLSWNLNVKNESNLRLILGRLSFLHTKNLKNPVKKLSELIFTNYQRVFQLRKSSISKQDYVQLLLEYSFALLFYYKYTQVEAILRHCSQILQMKIEFTGKLGRRTKYQQFDTPQLVMSIQEGTSEGQKQIQIQQEEQNHKLEFIDAKQLVNKLRQTSINESELNSIRAATYNQDSILLQTPHFVEQGNVQKQEKKINQYHLLVVLTTIYYEWRSTPRDEMQYQNIAASIMYMLKEKTNTSYSFNFSMLLLRSINDFPRIKHAERALQQFDRLKAVFNHKVNKSVYNLYSTPYETNLSYVLILADKYMEIGLNMAAIQLFEQAGLYQQCADVLIQKSYKERALQIINKLIAQNGTNPRILCMLGDIHKDNIKYYEQAWEMSKHCSARAMRALGWIYYNKQNYQKAAECFQKATQASYYHPSTWFTLGCCYMKSLQYDKALRAFGQCITIDDSQGDAWGNIASCYMHQKKMKEAYSTLEQAVKYSEGNWMLWANLITVSLVVKKFYKYFQAIERIAKLGRQEILTETIFKKIIQIMQFKNESDQRRRIIFNFRNRINRLYDFLVKTIGQNPLVWRSKSEYEIEILEYIEIMRIHYLELHQKNAIDPNDIVPGYESLQSTFTTTNQDIAVTKSLIVNCKQSELNMTMRVGWDENKIESEKVKKVLFEYIEIYRKYSKREDKGDFRLFISGITQKLSHCLQQNIEISLDWL